MKQKDWGLNLSSAQKEEAAKEFAVSHSKPTPPSGCGGVRRSKTFNFLSPVAMAGTDLIPNFTRRTPNSK